MNRRRFTIIHTPVHDVTQADIVADVTQAVEQHCQLRLVGVNAQVCNLAARHRPYRTVLARGAYTYADGQSVVWAGRMLGGRFTERCATTDLAHPLLARAAERGWRVFFFGGSATNVERAAETMMDLYPGVEIRWQHGYLAADEVPALLDRIGEWAPHLIFVGLGEPQQQRWTLQHIDQLPACPVLTCGGLFDWLSGHHRRPPQWLVDAGFEWLARLVAEPRRLARRYLVGNPEFLARLGFQLSTLGVVRLRRRFSAPRSLDRRGR